MEYVKVPKERLAVLIGKKGSTKKEIEERLGVALTIDRDGTVTIEKTGEDPLAEWKAKNVVKAIGRGISPEKALLLEKDTYMLEIIDLSELLNSDKAIRRQKARIIGTKGRTRKFIEEATSCTLSIYGKSVAIIGEFEELQAAKRAVLMLVQGRPHSAVYRFLQEKAREFKEKRMLQLWEKPLI